MKGQNIVELEWNIITVVIYDKEMKCKFEFND